MLSALYFLSFFLSIVVDFDNLYSNIAQSFNRTEFLSIIMTKKDNNNNNNLIHSYNNQNTAVQLILREFENIQ